MATPAEMESAPTPTLLAVMAFLSAQMAVMRRDVTITMVSKSLQYNYSSMFESTPSEVHKKIKSKGLKMCAPMILY